jgi:SpoVK/Ycf46/Vps4 family AAA+-type ATPase
VAATEFRTLVELAATYDALRRRIDAGEVARADADATLSGLVGVDENGRRWAVDAAGAWREVGAAAAAGSGVRRAAAHDAEAERVLRAVLRELDALIGLAEVKKQVRELTALVRVQRLREAAGLPVVAMSHHLVFRGNPGTGKTTVARLIGRIYAALGVVPKGQVEEVDRSMLVAEYVGQTAIKTADAFGRARGGVLFIDEAYTLARDSGSGSGFGQEAIDTLVKLMEDHRDDTVLIVAGYPVEMDTFISTNPGLRSRFSRTIDFVDYSDDELLTIFVKLCRDGGYTATASAKAAVRTVLVGAARAPGFGNARAMRTLFERAVTAQAVRLASLRKPSRGTLRSLTSADVLPAS